MRVLVSCSCTVSNLKDTVVFKDEHVALSRYHAYHRIMFMMSEHAEFMHSCRRVYTRQTDKHWINRRQWHDREDRSSLREYEQSDARLGHDS